VNSFYLHKLVLSDYFEFYYLTSAKYSAAFEYVSISFFFVCIDLALGGNISQVSA
jgi:hypothetical protein